MIALRKRLPGDGSPPFTVIWPITNIRTKGHVINAAKYNRLVRTWFATGVVEL